MEGCWKRSPTILRNLARRSIPFSRNSLDFVSEFPGQNTRAVSIGIESGFPRGAKRRSLGGRFSFWDALRRRIRQFVRRLSTEVAPNSSLMQDILQHERNPL